ncbi:MAG TPA: hypothetical protein DCE41_04450 [Cytophagales bacterium]|nr:hypothetical protein [Cytophagales bacterium]
MGWGEEYERIAPLLWGLSEAKREEAPTGGTPTFSFYNRVWENDIQYRIGAVFLAHKRCGIGSQVLKKCAALIRLTDGMKLFLACNYQVSALFALVFTRFKLRSTHSSTVI